MTFTEIAHRLTGISSPFFGVSWVPPEADVTIAQRVLVFLEDRRVLFAPTEMEAPDHCIQSVLAIRAFVTEQLSSLDPGHDLAAILPAGDSP